MACVDDVLFQVKPYNVHVMLSFPPDTDTPMFNSENDIKVSRSKLSTYIDPPTFIQQSSILLPTGIIQ